MSPKIVIKDNKNDNESKIIIFEGIPYYHDHDTKTLINNDFISIGTWDKDNMNIVSGAVEYCTATLGLGWSSNALNLFCFLL